MERQLFARKSKPVALTPPRPTNTFDLHFTCTLPESHNHAMLTYLLGRGSKNPSLTSESSLQIARYSLRYFHSLSSKTDPHPSKETPFLHVFIPNPLPGLQKALLWRLASGHELQHGTKKRTKVVPCRCGA